MHLIGVKIAMNSFKIDRIVLESIICAIVGFVVLVTQLKVVVFGSKTFAVYTVFWSENKQ